MASTGRAFIVNSCLLISWMPKSDALILCISDLRKSHRLIRTTPFHQCDFDAKCILYFLFDVFCLSCEMFAVKQLRKFYITFVNGSKIKVFYDLFNIAELWMSWHWAFLSIGLLGFLCKIWTYSWATKIVKARQASKIFRLPYNRSLHVV